MAGNFGLGPGLGLALFAALSGLVGPGQAAVPGRAPAVAAAPLQSITSSDNRVSVATPTGGLSRTLISQLETMVAAFDTLFPGEGKPHGRLRVVVRRDAVGAGGYTRQVRLGEKGFVFTLYATIPPALEPRDFIVAATELLLYDFCTMGVDPNAMGQDLPRIPFWLIDGVAQTLMPSEYRGDLKGVVFAMARRQRVPSIATIQSWKTPSDSSLERIHQRAFNYWLFQELVRSKDYQQALLSWLRGLCRIEESDPVLWADTRTVDGWWSETVARSTSVARGANWSIEETRDLLAKALPSELNDPKDRKRRFEFPELGQAKPDALFFIEMKKKEEVLMTLAQRGDILYRTVPAAYLVAVQALLDRLPAAEFRQRAARAAAEEARLEKTRDDVRDYLNWFEVERMPGDPERDFGGFFSTSRRLERLDLRPQDPLSLKRLRVGAED